MSKETDYLRDWYAKLMRDTGNAPSEYTRRIIATCASSILDLVEDLENVEADALIAKGMAKAREIKKWRV
jgi:hypothetical protein